MFCDFGINGIFHDYFHPSIISRKNYSITSTNKLIIVIHELLPHKSGLFWGMTSPKWDTALFTNCFTFWIIPRWAKSWFLIFMNSFRSYWSSSSGNQSSNRFCKKTHWLWNKLCRQRFKPKTSLKISSIEPIDMPTSSASSHNQMAIFHYFVHNFFDIFFGYWCWWKARTRFIFHRFTTFTEWLLPFLTSVSSWMFRINV